MELRTNCQAKKRSKHQMPEGGPDILLTYFPNINRGHLNLCQSKCFFSANGLIYCMVQVYLIII